MIDPLFPMDFVLQTVGGERQDLVSCSGFSGVGTDSRQDLSGQLFIALRGDRFDAHDFLEQACRSGAAGVLVDREEALKGLPSSVVKIVVKDTLAALQSLAHHWRLKMNSFLLAVTGSNGKTSTKEFLYQILSQSLPTHRSRGSFNNHWGVPLTLLELRSHHSHGVLEMGMNHSGEIRSLVKIAQPQVVACTNVGRAHQGNFGSLEELARAKEEIYTAQKGLQVRIFNLDNPWTSAMQTRYVSDAKLMTFSTQNPAADVLLKLDRMESSALHLSGHLLGRKGEATVPVFGRQHVENLACAAAMAMACGLTSDQVWSALSGCRTTWGRGEWVQTAAGYRVLFDAYNANPDSFSVLIDNLKELPAQPGEKRWLIASDMLEMGNEAEASHRALGDRLCELPWSGVIFFGAWGSVIQQHLPAGIPFLSLADFDSKAVMKFAQDHFSEGDLVVLKGSRGGRLERVVDLFEPMGWSPKS